MAACTLDRHRDEVRELLAPVVARIAAEPGEELDLSDPELPGRVLARPCAARTPIPAFDNSQMDGYAVRAADLAGAGPAHPVTLPIGRATAAGDPPLEHVSGTASPIMTGAAIPLGADTIVPIEEARPDAFPELSRVGDPEPTGTVAFAASPAPGRFVRRRGEDVEAGAAVAEAGARLTPSVIGALAAAGTARVAVRPRARVLLCSTGDELTSLGGELEPGRIHDANTPMLRAALQGLGARVDVLRTGDSPAQLRDALLARAGDADVVITSGGISKGAFEVVREALAPLGARFHAVAMQPGGPQGLALLPSEHGSEHVEVPVLCFPGNPVSAILSLELFLAPTLRALAGLPAERETLRLPLAHDVESPAAKHQVRRAALDAAGRVRVFAPGSHLVGELADARLLVHLPVGLEHAAAGTLVDTWRFND